MVSYSILISVAQKEKVCLLEVLGKVTLYCHIFLFFALSFLVGN